VLALSSSFLAIFFGNLPDPFSRQPKAASNLRKRNAWLLEQGANAPILPVGNAPQVSLFE
jgi:hypothetical protein